MNIFFVIFFFSAINHMEVPTKSENHKNNTNSNSDFLTFSKEVSFF